MILAHFLTEVNEANMFLVGCEEQGEALLVDAAGYDPRLDPFLEKHGLRLTCVFVTHDHYDHIGALKDIVEAHGTAVYAGAAEVVGLSVHKVGQGDALTFGAVEGRVIALPGHTPTSVGLVLPGMVFTGDALFAGSIGGVSSLHDKAIEMDHIRRNVFSLPDEYEVHTGHGPSSTVGVEKASNPFFN